MRSTDGNTDVVDCCVSTMVLPLFYSSGAVVYRKPVLSVAHHLHNLFYTLHRGIGVIDSIAYGLTLPRGWIVGIGHNHRAVLWGLGISIDNTALRIPR